jgi:hypothetical protein
MNCMQNFWSENAKISDNSEGLGAERGQPEIISVLKPQAVKIYSPENKVGPILNVSTRGR